MNLIYSMTLPLVTIEITRGPKLLTGSNEAGDLVHESGITWTARSILNGELFSASYSVPTRTYNALKMNGVAADTQNEEIVLLRLYRQVRAKQPIK